MPTTSSQSSAGASYSGLPLSQYGFAPIIGYTPSSMPWGGLNYYYEPRYGEAPADKYLGYATSSAAGLQDYANSINPSMFGNAANVDANFLQDLAKKSAGMFDFNIPYAKQALRAAFDPQKAFMRQNLADLQEQSRQGQALRGVAMTPYGAGAEANAVGRFLNDWRDRQINRMLTGSQAASTLEQPVLGARQLAGQLFSSSGQLRLGAAQQMLSAYGLKGDALKNATQAFLGILDAMKIGESANVSGGRSSSD